jgi:hypothetical protein
MRTITLEAHFAYPGFLEGPGRQLKERALRFGGAAATLLEQLCDLGEKRIAEMDAAGIDIQVLSLTSPGTEQLEAADGITMAREANEFLAAAVKRNPTRFAGFATLPTASPDKAAEELEKMVREHGFKGMLHARAGTLGLTPGRLASPHQVYEFPSVSAVDLKLDGDRHRTVVRMWRVNEFVRKGRERGRIEIEASGKVDREWMGQSKTNQEQNRRSKQRISRACRCDSATPDHPAKSQSSLRNHCGVHAATRPTGLPHRFQKLQRQSTVSEKPGFVRPSKSRSSS